MGAVGSQESLTYMNSLKDLDLPVHILVCIGKNRSIRRQLEQITLPSHITITIIGFTQRISDLMAVSDLMITKTGTVSVMEGIYMNLPLLLDQTSPSLMWEAFNLDFVESHGFGERITDYSQVNSLVKKYLCNPSYLSSVINKLSSFEKKHFGTELKKLLEKIFSTG